MLPENTKTVEDEKHQSDSCFKPGTIDLSDTETWDKRERLAENNHRTRVLGYIKVIARKSQWITQKKKKNKAQQCSSKIGVLRENQEQQLKLSWQYENILECELLGGRECFYKAPLREKDNQNGKTWLVVWIRFETRTKWKFNCKVKGKQGTVGSYSRRGRKRRCKVNVCPWAQLMLLPALLSWQ